MRDLRSLNGGRRMNHPVYKKHSLDSESRMTLLVRAKSNLTDRPRENANAVARIRVMPQRISRTTRWENTALRCSPSARIRGILNCLLLLLRYGKMNDERTNT